MANNNNNNNNNKQPVFHEHVVVEAAFDGRTGAQMTAVEPEVENITDESKG